MRRVWLQDSKNKVTKGISFHPQIRISYVRILHEKYEYVQTILSAPNILVRFLSTYRNAKTRQWISEFTVNNNNLIRRIFFSSIYVR